MLTEVVFAAASALWWGGEALSPTEWLGGGLILLTAVMAAREG
jgi:drug/metabolite transporter (DMT)-like permease